MPPKKKGKKKGKKSGKKGKGARKSAKSDSQESTEGMEDMNKEFYIMHIRDLERKVKRYRAKYDGLMSENDEFVNTLKEMSVEKKDLVHFLKKSLINRGDEVEDLKERHFGLQQTKETEKSQFEAQLQALRSEFQEMKDQLTSENNALTAKLAALEEFKAQKQRLLKQYEALQTKLQDMKDQHGEIMEKIGIKGFQDRDRLKKELVSRINMVASEFRKVSHKQMADTTKRTIRENVSIQTQLTKMTSKMTEIASENEELVDKVKKFHQRMRNLESSHDTLATKNNSNQKIVALLDTKQREHAQYLQEYKEQDEVLRQLDKLNTQLEKEIDEKTNQMEVLDCETAELTQQSVQFADKLSEVRDQIQDAKDALQDSVKRLKELLQAQRLSRTTSRMTGTSSSLRIQTDMAEDEKLEAEWGNLDERARVDGEFDLILDALAQLEDVTDDIYQHDFSSEGLDTKLKATVDADMLAGTPSISLPSSAAVTTKQRLPEVAKVGVKPRILTEAEVRLRTKELAERQELGYCVPGCLQLVPPAGTRILTHLEKSLGHSRYLRGIDPDPENVEPDVVQTRSLAIQTMSIPKMIFKTERQM